MQNSEVSLEDGPHEGKVLLKGHSHDYDIIQVHIIPCTPARTISDSVSCWNVAGDLQSQNDNHIELKKAQVMRFWSLPFEG